VNTVGRGDGVRGDEDRIDRGSQTQTLIVRWRGGDEDARDALIARLHPELEKIAVARLRGERGCSLSAGDLVNDAILRLIRINEVAFADRTHVLALSARMMRRILIERARHMAADKRRHERVQLNTSIDGVQRFDVIALETALVRLGSIDAQLSEIVELRYFAGMTLPEVAEILEVSESTALRRWQAARAWLGDALSNPVVP
jgi:RNA polymerase sigma factor (TIGR02999 family)